MYAHQVIEDLRTIYNKYAGQKVDADMFQYFQHLRSIASLIYQSQCFHLGEGSELCNLFGKTFFGKQLFQGDTAKDVKLPYKKCFFDFYEKGNGKPLSMHETKAPKRAIAVWEQDTDLWVCYMITFLEKLKMWVVSDYYFWISIGKPLKEHSRFIELLELNNINTEKMSDITNIQPVPMNKSLKSLKNINPQQIIDVEASDLSVLNVALILLSCKNVLAMRNPAPLALNKARRKKGKTEIFTYHTLKLVPFGNKKQYQSSQGEPESHYRIHLCRGHFKRYAEDKPLFGKYTGLYWWQPTVRGKDKSGVVMKDYALSTSN